MVRDGISYRGYAMIYERYDLEQLFGAGEPVSGPHSYRDACLRFMSWVCPRCGHLMDIWPQTETFLFKCGSRRENLFDGIYVGDCPIAVIVEKSEYRTFIEIDLRDYEYA